MAVVNHALAAGVPGKLALPTSCPVAVAALSAPRHTVVILALPNQFEGGPTESCRPSIGVWLGFPIKASVVSLGAGTNLGTPLTVGQLLPSGEIASSVVRAVAAGSGGFLMVNLQARFDESLSSLQLHSAVSPLLWGKAGRHSISRMEACDSRKPIPHPLPPLTQAWELSSDI